MQVTLNDKSTKELKECLAILTLVSDLGDRISHADANAIAINKYREQLEERHPEAAKQVTKPKK